VVCHGDFLNADHEYVHKNKSFRGFGSYGDIMIRDRKMYVAPTPFGLVSGVAHFQTLILPQGFSVMTGLRQVGTLMRKEAERLIVGYSFNLRRNVLTPRTVPNPSAGRVHIFRAWRLDGGPDEPVVMHEAALANDDDPENDCDE
jgi:hypothetical protein